MQTEYTSQDAPRPAITRRRALGIVARGAALGALSAGAVVAISPPPAEAVAPQDALLDLVRGYEAARSAWNSASFETDELGDDAYDLAVKPFRDRLLAKPPAAMTEAGVVAALRFVRDDMNVFASEDYSLTVDAAIAFFEKGAN